VPILAGEHHVSSATCMLGELLLCGGAIGLFDPVFWQAIGHAC